MLEIIKLDKKNFNDFIALLLQRGEAPEDYYRWKYLMQPVSDRPTGLIAYLDGIPVGCIGIINRIYHTSEGKKHFATWFADWFLTKQSRGMGIGKKLMECVRTFAPYNFGIPGPILAQQVCEGAGYKYSPGLSDAIFYLNPFICGYYRGQGSTLKRFLRGSKFFIMCFSRIFSFIFKEPTFFCKHDSHNQFIFEISKFYPYALPTLERNIEFVSWLSTMPTKVNSDRFWWTIKGKGYNCWGFIENDFWGLAKAQILDIVSFNNNEAYISEICKTLKLKGVDLVRCVVRNSKLQFDATELQELPVYYCGPELPQLFYITSLDKESSWREFTLT